VSDTLTDDKVEERTAPAEPGDHDRFSHYVHKSVMADAYIEGKPIKAVCGKVWVPTRDGSKFPICQDCKRIYDQFKQD
jgi:hypothetical protein